MIEQRGATVRAAALRMSCERDPAHLFFAVGAALTDTIDVRWVYLSPSPFIACRCGLRPKSMPERMSFSGL